MLVSKSAMVFFIHEASGSPQIAIGYLVDQDGSKWLAAKRDDVDRDPHDVLMHKLDPRLLEEQYDSAFDIRFYLYRGRLVEAP